jgi:hypothetical protein
MTDKPVVFISCGIFREELDYLSREGAFERKVIFLDAALHVNFDLLKARLEEVLEKASREGGELKVVYGHCHPDMRDILERYGARRIAAGNCLEAFVGREEVDRLNAEATTFFLSAGWVNHWSDMFTLGRETLGFDFKEMFAHYKRIIVFDTGVIPIDKAKVEAFSAFTGLPVEWRRITLDHFKRLLEAF